MRRFLACSGLIIFVMLAAYPGICFPGIEGQVGGGLSFPAINMTERYSTMGLNAAVDIIFPANETWAVDVHYSINRFFPGYQSNNLHLIGICAEWRGMPSGSGVVPYSLLGLGYVASPRAIYDGWSLIGGFGARISLSRAVSFFFRGDVVIGGPGGMHQDAFVYFPVTVGLYLRGKNEAKHVADEPLW